MPRKNKFTLTRGVHRPSCWNLKPIQPVVIVADNSPSMLKEKAEQAAAAIQDILNLLALKANKDGFYAAVVYFARIAIEVHQLALASRIKDRLSPFSEQLYDIGYTNITAGLEQALQIVNEFKAHPPVSDAHYLEPVVILFTDGNHNKGNLPHETARELKRVADLVTVSLGDDADDKLLRDLATSSQHFCRCATGRELREFLFDVGKTLCKTRSAGLNATASLKEITRQ